MTLKRSCLSVMNVTAMYCIMQLLETSKENGYCSCSKPSVIGAKDPLLVYPEI